MGTGINVKTSTLKTELHLKIKTNLHATCAAITPSATPVKPNIVFPKTQNDTLNSKHRRY